VLEAAYASIVRKIEEREMNRKNLTIRDPPIRYISNLFLHKRQVR
jgi:hypothetical protein